MDVKISKYPNKNRNDSLDSDVIKNNNKRIKSQKTKYFINKKYQRFISVIFYLIGFYFLFFLFRFLTSIYVSLSIYLLQFNPQYKLGIFLITCIFTAELYLSLGYFYYKKYKLNNLYGPNQLSLICLQIIGIAFIGCNYYINIKSNLSETYLFFMDNKKSFFLGYLFCGSICFIVLLITTTLIISRKRKIEMYKVLNETKI